MSSEHDLPDVDAFTAGTVGEPGQRVFYLQAVAGAEVVTLRLEKGQVAALAQYLAELLADLPTPPAEQVVASGMELQEPVDAEWIVGQLGVVFDESRDRMVVRADEIATEEEVDDTLGFARFALTRAQVQAFVVRAATLLEAGRPPCPLCGRPIDPEGHMCIKTNGHAKH